MCAARARKVYDDVAYERQIASGKNFGRGKVVAPAPQPLKGKARDAAGKAFGIAGRTVDYASQVLRDGDDSLVKAVAKTKYSFCGCFPFA